jgi:catechol 2,3-dioxygenase-like lactoylglutathione lyase family enzyme
VAKLRAVPIARCRGGGVARRAPQHTGDRFLLDVSATPRPPKETDMANPKQPAPAPSKIDTKLEVVVIPVADVDRAKSFYTDLGWRLDGDFAWSDDYRTVQVTPPGSQCSVIFGKGVTPAAPGSAVGLFLVVSDLEAARIELRDRKVDVSAVFHRNAKGERVEGPDPKWLSYGSYAAFRDPDGNMWLLQQITRRLPGRVQGPWAYASQNDLANAMRRAEAAHGKHEQQLGHRDENWPDWYAEFMISEQSGKEPPK